MSSFWPTGYPDLLTGKTVAKATEAGPSRAKTYEPVELTPTPLHGKDNDWGPLILQSYLEHAPRLERGKYGTMAQATLVFHVFHALWSAQRDGQSYFLPPGDKPPQKGEWTRVDVDHVVMPFSLHDRQEKWKAAQKREGKQPERRQGPCGKVIIRGEKSYTCKTCGQDSSNHICVDCFREGDHEGHDVIYGQSFAFTTVCDCGVSSAWRSEGVDSCRHHSCQDAPPPEPLPALIQHSIEDTMAIIIDFIIETLQHSPQPNDFGKLSSTADIMAAGLDLHSRTTAEPIERRGLPPWSVILWSDDKHVLRETTRQIRDGTGFEWKKSTKIAREAEVVGRKVIATSDDMISVYHTASMLQQIELSVTLRSATDTFREQACMTLLHLLADFVECSVGGDFYVFRRALAKVLLAPKRNSEIRGSSLSPELDRLHKHHKTTSRLEWMLALDAKLWKQPKMALRRILMAINATSQEYRISMTVNFLKAFNIVFNNYLFQDREGDTNLAYSLLHPIFRDGEAAAIAVEQGAIGHLCTIAQACYSGRYEHAQIGTEHIDIDCLDQNTKYNLDLTPNRSKKILQLFPWIGLLLTHDQVKSVVRSHPRILHRLLQFLNPFVGLQPLKRARETHVDFEPDFQKTFMVLAEAAKLCHIIGECYAVGKGDDTMQALRMVKDRIFNDLMLDTWTLPMEHFSVPSQHKVKDVLGNGNECTVLRFIVSRSYSTSFHYHMHLIFAELIKGLAIVPEMNNGTFEFANFLNRYLFSSDQLRPSMPLLCLIEDPLQKHVVISQIRLGHWARNGQAMRVMVHYYTDGPIHEYTIDQEFFLLQVGLCSMDPQLFVTAAIDRYELADLFRGPIDAGTCWEGDMDSTVRAGLLADFLRLLIALVSDTDTITRKSQRDITRKYIIHILALNSYKYSSILKRLPDRCTNRDSIETVLEEVADFKEATMTTEGMYSLKSEMFDEVDPFFHHYQSNERDDARKVLLARAIKRNPANKMPVLLPRTLDVPAAPRMFHNIADFLRQDVVVAVCHYAISHCINMGEPSKFPGLEFAVAMPQLEGVFEAALHLCMLAIQVDAKAFAIASQRRRDNTETSMFHIIWYIHTLKFDVFKPFMPTLNYIINSIIENLPEEHAASCREAVQRKREADESAAAKAPQNPTKAKAAARRKALMASLTQQQAQFKSGQAFRDIVGDEEDDDMDEDDEKVEVHGTCINCQDEVSADRPGGMLAMLQPSRIIREVANDREWLMESVRTPSSLDKKAQLYRYGWGSTGEPMITDGYPSSQLRLGIHINACGHLMHETCLANFFEMTQIRHHAQLQRHQPENAARQEYICPLCKSLSNVLIPVDKTLSPVRGPLSKLAPSGGPLSLKDRIRQISNEGLMGVSDSQRIWDHKIESGEIVPWFADHLPFEDSLDPSAREGRLSSVSTMIDRLRMLTKPTSEQSIRLRKRGQTASMYLPDDMVGYVVAMSEIAQRGIESKGTTVAENLNETATRTIKALVSTLQLELDLFFGPKYDRTSLRVGIFARFLPDWYRATVPAPVLSRDPMGLVIEAAALAPDVIQSVIVLGYYLELSRTILGLATWTRRCLQTRSTSAARPPKPDDPDLEQALSIFGSFRGIVAEQIRSAGAFGDVESFLGLMSDDTLSKLLYSHTLPFLRRATILYYSLHGSYPVNSEPPAGCEYRRLLHTLDIPDPFATLSNPSSTIHPIATKWIIQWSTRGRTTPALEYPGIYELYRLPREHQMISRLVAKRRCEKCGLEPSVPALCMFCGKFLCLAGDCCAEGEQGECNLHMRECGATVGMFLDLKRWQILYLFAGTGSFASAPFLDVHGELDSAIRRGYFQFLQEDRAEELRRAIWLGHGIPSYTARRLELMTDGGGWGCL